MNQPPDHWLAGVPLHDIEIEQGLLGALLIANVNFDVVAGKLQPEHFFEPLHHVIFAEIARKIALGEPATPLTARGALPATLDIAGMSSDRYLARLAAEATIGMNVPHFADTVMQYKAARENVLNARDLLDGRLGGIPIDEALRISITNRRPYATATWGLACGIPRGRSPTPCMPRTSEWPLQ
jgi:replicative DNA helicase